VQRDVLWRTVDGERLTADVYLPPTERTGRPAVVMIHGGGWRQGDKQILARQSDELAKLGYVAVSINYRLAPAHPYPAAVDDVQAAVRWLRADRQVERYGIDPEQIGALGGSAGAHLAAMAGTLGRGALDTGARVRAVVEWSGPMDLTGQGLDPRPSGVVATFLGCLPEECPKTAAAASPVTHVDATDAPMLVVNSTDELVPERQARAIAGALEDAGVDHDVVIVPGTKHASALTDDVWDETVAFLRRHLGKPKP
jgi:acetyl esterase/lipase